MSEQSPATQREKVLQLLPFYVNGSLSDADQKLVESELIAQPILQRELAFQRALATHVQEHTERAPASIGLGKVLARIAQTETSEKKSSGIWQTVSAWLTGGAWMKPALALSLTAVVAQAWLLSQRPSIDEVQYRGGSDRTERRGTKAGRAYLSVVFQPTTSEAQLRMLLAGLSAQIVSGPGDSGEYVLEVPADAASAIQTKLQQSGMTSNVMATRAPW
jgi:hypothetical protein